MANDGGVHGQRLCAGENHEQTHETLRQRELKKLYAGLPVLVFAPSGKRDSMSGVENNNGVSGKRNYRMGLCVKISMRDSLSKASTTSILHPNASIFSKFRGNGSHDKELVESRKK